MKLLSAILFWSGAAIWGLCLLPFVVLAVLIGIGCSLVTRGGRGRPGEERLGESTDEQFPQGVALSRRVM